MHTAQSISDNCGASSRQIEKKERQAKLQERAEVKLWFLAAIWQNIQS